MFMELTSLKGIGDSRAKSFEENDIFSCEDLINYFPYKYYDFSKTEPFAEDGKARLIKATVTENAKVVKVRTNFSFVSCKMIDEIGHTFTAMWFNQPYVKSQLYLGANVYVYGKNSPTKKNHLIVNIYKFEGKFNNFGFLPIYHSIDKLGQNTIKNAIEESLQKLNLSSFIPDLLLSKYSLLRLNEAYTLVHHPKKEEDIKKAHFRISIEKLVPILAINEYHKLTAKDIKAHKIINGIEIFHEFEKLLPFALTPDQKNAMLEIERDISSKFSMNRMLQGDVGSGKTLVAMFAAFVLAKNGYQAAIVAPTEILANQHFQTARNLFLQEKFEVCKLTGSTSGINKQLALKHIENGYAKIIIGTHTLFADGVRFKNLAFICIDEQHRFGVCERAKLKEKGITPDVLVMSATPIPRSMSLVLYGNLDISVIKSRPRPINITTNIVINSKQHDMWKYLKNQTLQGSKVYVVCAKIDEENDDDDVIKYSAKNMYDMLLGIFDASEVALLHGKLKKEVQNKILDKFKNGQVKVLVSTTIVEVGVDVPDSDFMVIATPERFGLATLHQLRGRIGRNGNKAWCFCLADNLKEKSYERINFFKNHTNGFEIADFDLQTRGSGSIIGTNQHGIDKGILAHFSNEAFRLSIEILEQIKLNPTIYAKVLEIGSQFVSREDFKKIVLN